MPSITFDRFEIGIDRRKGRRVSDANRLWQCKNAYITSGWRPRKRPGLTVAKNLTAGTIGLVSANGELNTFSLSTPVTHTGGTVNVTDNELTDEQFTTLTQVDAADVFNGYIYGAFTGTGGLAGTEHHYFDGGAGGSRVGTRVSDVNCPNTAALLKTASKIFSVDGEEVDFSATDKPWDWTTTNDAGSLPTGRRAPGSPDALVLGLYNELLAVGSSDSMQTWNVDPDPALMSINEVVENAGSRYPRSIGNVSGDMYYLTDRGVISLSTLSLTNNLADVDVGSPIDEIVLEQLALGYTRISSAWFNSLGQYWLAFTRASTTTVLVYSFSRTAKVSAWSIYEFSVSITDFAELDAKLYCRSGDTVYLVDPDSDQDDGVNFTVEIESTFLDFKKPGQRKHVIGMDIALREGSPSLSLKWDAKNPDSANHEGPVITPESYSVSGDLIPYELNSTEIAWKLTHAANEPLELEALMFYYEVLGAM